MTPDDTNTPTIHRIMPDNPPQFPCWIWSGLVGLWWHADEPWQKNYTASDYDADGQTHWCQSPKRPTVTPDAPTPPALPQESAATRDDLDDPQFCGLPPWPRPPSCESRVLPGPVWNALTNAAAKIEDVALRQRFLVEAEKCLAPLWPRPAPVTADARELAERILSSLYRHSPDRHDRAEDDIAAVLAPVLARAAAAEAAQVAAEREAAEVRKAWNEREPQLRAAEVERDELRAEVLRLQGIASTNADQLAETERERDELRAEVERLTNENTLLSAGPAAAGWWSPATAKAYEKETADLRAQVARMNRRVHHGEHTDDCPFCLSITSGPGGSDPMCHLCKLESERDELRDYASALETALDARQALLTAYERDPWAQTIADLRAQLADARQAVAAARAQAREAMEDKERLDWLENDCHTYVVEDNGFSVVSDGKEYDGKTLRAAIDAARQEGGAK